MNEFTLGTTSTIYADGRAVYSIRRKGKPGIVTTLALTGDEKAALLDKGVFEDYEGVIRTVVRFAQPESENSMTETFTNRRVESLIVKDNEPASDPERDAVSISTTSSTGFGTSREYGKQLPPGTAFVMETTRGSMITGIQIEGVWLYHKSDETLAAEHEEFVAKLEADHETNLAENREEYQKREDALPDWLKVRFATFHEKGGHNFEKDGWGYELIIAEMAVILAEDGLESYDVKGSRFDEFASEQGVSGNQAGFAKMLARSRIENPEESLAGTIGGLSPLTGDAFYEGKK